MNLRDSLIVTAIVTAIVTVAASIVTAASARVLTICAKPTQSLATPDPFPYVSTAIASRTRISLGGVMG